MGVPVAHGAGMRGLWCLVSGIGGRRVPMTPMTPTHARGAHCSVARPKGTRSPSLLLPSGLFHFVARRHLRTAGATSRLSRRRMLGVVGAERKAREDSLKPLMNANGREFWRACPMGLLHGDWGIVSGIQEWAHWAHVRGFH